MLLYVRQVSTKSSFSIFPTLSLRKYYRRLIMTEIKPPPEVQGQTILQKEAFKKEVEIPVFILTKVTISKVLTYLKPYFLKLENWKPVQNLNGDIEIYLNPILVKDFSSFSSDIQGELMNENLTKANLQLKKITLGYENFSLETILRAVLPLDKEGGYLFIKLFIAFDSILIMC